MSNAVVNFVPFDWPKVIDVYALQSVITDNLLPYES